MPSLYNQKYAVITVIIFLLLTACGQNDHQHKKTVASYQDSVLHIPDVAPLTDSINQFPDNAQLYYERSGVLFQLQQYKLAKQDMQQAILLHPSTPELYYALGQIDASLNNPDTAEADFRLALLFDHQNNDARLSLANLYYHQKKYTKALSQLDTLKQIAPRLAQANGLSSIIYEEMGDTAKAINEMKEAVKKAPGNYEAIMGLGDLLSSRHNPQALVWYQKAFRLDTTKTEALYSEGKYYLNIKDTAHAIKILRRSIETNGNYLQSYMKLGELYRLKNNWTKARKLYLITTKIAPSNADAYYFLGLCEEKTKHKEKAISYYRQAQALNSSKASEALKRLHRQ